MRTDATNSIKAVKEND